LLAHQGIVDGARLLLSDLDGATFPMLQGHTALLAPIAGNPQEAQSVIGLALGECGRRAALYQVAGGYPENLDEYNGLAIKAGDETLPRLLVILDEFNATILALGGANGTFAGDVAALTWRGRKFGVNVICAAQDFAKTIVGRMRDQVSSICFRVQSKELALAVSCAGAWKIARPGRAISQRWGAFQAYWLDKASLVTSTAGAGILSANELAMIGWAIEENDGYLSLADMMARGMGQGEARRLAREWELRGWLVKDNLSRNKRRISDDLRQIAYKLQSLQSLQTPMANLQTGLQTELAQPTNLQTDPDGPLAGIVGILTDDLPRWSSAN